MAIVARAQPLGAARESQADALHVAARSASWLLGPVMSEWEAAGPHTCRVERTQAPSTWQAIDTNDARRSVAFMVERESLGRG